MTRCFLILSGTLLLASCVAEPQRFIDPAGDGDSPRAAVEHSSAPMDQMARAVEDDMTAHKTSQAALLAPPDEFTFEAVDGGQIITLHGAPAMELYDAMVTSGAFASRFTQGAHYASGAYSICGATPQEAICQLWVAQGYAAQGLSETDNDIYALVFEGARFDSSATDVYLALTLAAGLAPVDTVEVHGERLGCSKTTDTVTCGVTHGENTAGQMLELSLTLTGLGDLGPNAVYEGWLITSDGPVSSGRFQLTAADETVTMSVPVEVADDSSPFVLTIEPARNDDPAPAATHVLAGDFDDSGLAELTIAHPAALGSDFTSASGGYILETPTSAEVADDFAQGVWFLDPVGPTAGLTLPALPDGWAYEGWVVGADGPISTGRFIDPARADVDNGGLAAGFDPAPPFPGQDFISPVRRLTEGYGVVLSVEPVLDNSPAPFFFKPLLDGEIESVGPGVFQTMGNNAAASAPAGTASLN